MRARISVVIAILLFALFSIIELPSANAVASDGVGVSTNGLLFFYDNANYGGMTNSTTVKDLSGNGRDGTIIPSSSQPSVSTNNGGYFSFNGNGGYMSAASMTSITNSFTATFYANFGTTANNFERIIDFGNGPTNNNLEIGREGTSSTLFVEMFNGGSSPGYCRASSAIDSAWHFWVVSISGGKCNIYKDNTQIVTDFAYSGTVASVTWSNMYIGKSNWVADAAFEGGIGELAFYNRALTSTEATQNYNAAMDQTAPTLSSGLLTQSLPIAENLTSVGTLTGSEIGTQFTMLNSSDSSKFSLAPFGGASTTLSFISPPNYESTTSLSLTNNYTSSILIFDGSGNWNTLTITVTVTNVAEYSSVTLPSLSASATKGVQVTITVTPSVAAGSGAGKVTFLIAGKRIPGCYSKSFTSGNSTCLWKPSITGLREITVTYTPTNSEYALSTNKKSFQILRRTTIR